MHRVFLLVILFIVTFACGKKEEPAPQEPPSSAAPTAPQTGPTPAVPSPETQATPMGESSKVTDGKYVVAEGDTLYHIAKEHGLNFHDLAKWNAIKDPRRLRVGQELRLAAPDK